MKPKPVKVLPDPAATRLVLIGCGGTGGYALQQVCRLLYGLKAERRELRAAPTLRGEDPPDGVPEVLLVDGDTVSADNLRRQYFLSCDVNRKKALVLAERYGAAYGLEVAAYPKYLTPETDLTRIIHESSW
jgi:tRNA A37 threonylcarbamoyladenosine dehydratase